MADVDPLPPLGSPELRRLSTPVPSENVSVPATPRAAAFSEPPIGHPSGVAVDTVPVSPEIRRAIDAEKERVRVIEESAARGRIVIPELCLPRFIAGSGFLLGIVSILSLVGLFVFGQTISVLAQIAVLPTAPRRLCYGLLAILLAAIAFAAVQLLVTYFRLRRTRRITLRSIDEINARAHLRQLIASETDDAFRIVREYLDDFPTDLKALCELGFKNEHAEKLLRYREDLTDVTKNLGSAEWLKRFRTGFQSVIGEAADECITRHARRVGLGTAAVPLALVDTGIVLYGSFTMISDLCRIYRLRMSASGTLIITGWAAFQSILAGRIEDWNGREVENWVHDFRHHVGGDAAVADSVHEVGATTLQDTTSVLTRTAGDLHVPFVGTVFKRAAKGLLQYMLVRRLGLLTQRWLRIVD